MNKILLTLILFFVTSIALANNPIHSWHNVTSQNGQWHATLKGINELSNFVAADGITPVSTFSVNPQSSFKYGFSFDPKDDFNVAYTLTLTQESVESFSSKTCVFIITANGPANPDIRPISYNGAKCEYTVVQGVGEDYSVG
jgi:hypothetical protein